MDLTGIIYIDDAEADFSPVVHDDHDDCHALDRLADDGGRVDDNADGLGQTHRRHL